ncbi:hypothetical protein H113_03648 [Trichophyton rubrum MR1459]|uniref:Uncharacterized protein n=1 Tax=Trichophyton rubrum (strain ATCC MYA-4607 / CBS 118892) TaxID=559305 RepID=A0A080WLU4_TRIRC|nr:uncharacterized protein TERG_12216 [Trichophyton rubrum CBS 118892]EZF96108.1 hypothetical protein H113_03648 [Trichophyton rubrum MR1459]KFL61787.1 hypothetical protein TERG_12216 [Trichophyton rubrum CBS 118892]
MAELITVYKRMGKYKDHDRRIANQRTTHLYRILIGPIAKLLTRRRSCSSWPRGELPYNPLMKGVSDLSTPGYGNASHESCDRSPRYTTCSLDSSFTLSCVWCHSQAYDAFFFWGCLC